MATTTSLSSNPVTDSEKATVRSKAPVTPPESARDSVTPGFTVSMVKAGIANWSDVVPTASVTVTKQSSYRPSGSWPPPGAVSVTEL